MPHHSLSATSQTWLESVLARFGLSESQRHDCVASASINLKGVVITFLQPHDGEQNFLVAQALVGEVPPEGRCEPLFQLVLEVQATLCGPHAPVLGLDWPARHLLVSFSMDMPNLGGDEAAGILFSMQEIAKQWRETIAKMATAPATAAPQPEVRRITAGR